VREDVGVDGLALVVVRGEHLAGDLGIARFVGTDEAEASASGERGEAEEEKVAGEDEQNGELGEGDTEFCATCGADQAQTSLAFREGRRNKCRLGLGRGDQESS
jgi:hypothetical protein